MEKTIREKKTEKYRIITEKLQIKENQVNPKINP